MQTIESVKQTIQAVMAERDRLNNLLASLEEFLNGRPQEVKPPRIKRVKLSVEPPNLVAGDMVLQAGGLALIPNGQPPITFGGALKRVMREAVHPVTVDEAFNAVQSRWPSLTEDRERKNAQENIFYWQSKGYVEKNGIGALATYKVIDQEFFKEKDQ